MNFPCTFHIFHIFSIYFPYISILYGLESTNSTRRRTMPIEDSSYAAFQRGSCEAITWAMRSNLVAA